MISVRTPKTTTADSKANKTSQTLLKSAAEIRLLCTKLCLEILCLQSFAHFEGLVDTPERRERRETAKRWFLIVRELGTAMLQVQSTANPRTIGDLDVLARDLAELCDMAASSEHDLMILQPFMEKRKWSVSVIPFPCL